MLIEFGASVIGVGGKRLGEVDGLIVNAGTKRAGSLLVDAGFFDRGKHMVGVSAVASVDQNGIHLETTARAEAQSPTYAEEEVAFPQRVPPPETFIPAAGVGGPIIADDEVPSEYPHSDSFFEMAPIDPPPVEIESNLLENEVILGKGTHAVSSDGHKVGDVVAFTLGDMGLVDTITVSEGFIFKERATFNLSEIDEFGTNAVHLKLDRAQAEARS
jgi:uncharacterized protein YrrD